MTGKNLDTYTSLTSIHILTPNLHGRCYSIDCWHQTGTASEKYTCRYEWKLDQPQNTQTPLPFHLQSYRRKMRKYKKASMQKTGEQDSMIQLSWDIHTCPPREAVGLSLLGRRPWTCFYMSLNIHPPSFEIIHLCMLGIPQLQGGTWLWLVWILYLQPYYLLPAYIHL